MPAFIDECRHEWRRLGVPDSLAQEMAAELEADLAEAEADGVSAAELLGESDPRRFAATWARERGLVAEPSPPKSRKRLWLWAAAFVLALVFVVVLGLFAAAKVSVRTSISAAQPITVGGLVVPNLVGLKACHAKKIALESGFRVHRFPRSFCDATVVGQQPLRGSLIPEQRGSAHSTTVTLQLRG
jgi:hypothetical protein